MISNEDIDKIAKKVVEIQEKEKINKNPRIHPQIRDIREKYHGEIYKKFGSTGTIEDAIRIVATYKCGQRYVSRIHQERWQEYVEYIEKLYKDILGE